jgi:hypothetical protein
MIKLKLNEIENNQERSSTTSESAQIWEMWWYGISHIS